MASEPVDPFHFFFDCVAGDAHPLTRASEVELTQKMPPDPGGIFKFQAVNSCLLDFGFLEVDMLLGDRIVFPLDHFFCHRAAVFLCHIEKPGIGGAFQLDLDSGCLGHGDFLSVQFRFPPRDWNQL
jgi:hypothetical protein